MTTHNVPESGRPSRPEHDVGAARWGYPAPSDPTPRQWRPGPTPARRAWWWLAILAVVLLAAPAVLAAALPARHDPEDVVLTADGYEWEIPVHKDRGGPLRCETTNESMAGTLYDCPGAQLDMIGQERYEDRSRALARSLRLLAPTGMSAKKATGEGVRWYGELGVFFTTDNLGAPAIGLGKIGGGGEDPQDPEPLLVVAVVGDAAPAYAPLVWQALGGEPDDFYRELGAWSGLCDAACHPGTHDDPYPQYPEDVTDLLRQSAQEV